MRTKTEVSRKNCKNSFENCFIIHVDTHYCKQEIFGIPCQLKANCKNSQAQYFDSFIRRQLRFPSVFVKNTSRQSPNKLSTFVFPSSWTFYTSCKPVFFPSRDLRIWRISIMDSLGCIKHLNIISSLPADEMVIDHLQRKRKINDRWGEYDNINGNTPWKRKKK